MERIVRLENPIRDYDWGSRTVLAEFRGAASPAKRPEAELWIGAHPRASSRIGVDGPSLRDALRDDPEAALGEALLARFGPELPFLLKVLAVDRPLSIQAHPDARQAKAGYAREEAAGVPADHRERLYPDPRAKPELVCALTPFTALKGFRAPREILDGFARFAPSALDGALAPLGERADAEGWRESFERLLRLEPHASRALLEAAAAAARAADGPVAAWLLRLTELHPGDPGALAPLYLNLVTLAPGEALFLPAGELHAHLEGLAVEVMGNSDNVLRGGLTTKVVALDELLSILSFEPGAAQPVATRLRGGAREYDAPADCFRLSVVRPAEAPFVREGAGAEALLCTEGDVCVAGAAGAPIDLTRGAAVFVPHAAGSYRISGTGAVHRVHVPAGSTGP